MDFGDGDFSAAFVGPEGPGEDATSSEQLAAGIAQWVFPTLIFCVVLFAELWKHGLRPLLLLAGGLSLAGYVITRLLSERPSFALTTALRGAFWSALATGAAALVGAFMSVSSGFS